MHPFIFYSYNMIVILSRGSVGSTWTTSRVKANQTILCLFVYMQDCGLFFSPFFVSILRANWSARKNTKRKSDSGVEESSDEWQRLHNVIFHAAGLPTRPGFDVPPLFLTPVSQLLSQIRRRMKKTKILPSLFCCAGVRVDWRLLSSALVHSLFPNSSSQRGVALSTNPIKSHLFYKPSRVILELCHSQKKWCNMSSETL